MSFQEIHDQLFKEHEAQYEYLTRLLLTLSVGFITFTTAIKSNEIALFSELHKASIVCHGLSILFGVWLQFIMMRKPIEDLQEVSKLMQTSEKIKNGGNEYFPRTPSKVQEFCFNTQIGLFLLALCLVIISIL